MDHLVSIQWRLVTLNLSYPMASFNDLNLYLFQRYDVRLNKWLMVTSMSSRRSSVGAAVLQCLHLEKVLSMGKHSL